MGIGTVVRAAWYKMTKKRPSTAAVILAGGSGSRMGDGAVSKQRMLLLGKTVLAHSILAFEECDLVDEIVIVSKKEEIQKVKEDLEGLPIRKLRRIVSGGPTRQQSARHGLEAISKGMKYIAIHDAARCLVTPEMIRNVIREAYQHGAACAGTPVTDTIKKVRPSGYVERSVDRTEYWAAQTPQVFRETLYRSAAYSAKKYVWQATDDAMLVEKIGHRVMMVDCGFENRKITYPVDIQIAEQILRHRAAEKEGEGTQ